MVVKNGGGGERTPSLLSPRQSVVGRRSVLLSLSSAGGGGSDSHRQPFLLLNTCHVQVCSKVRAYSMFKDNSCFNYNKCSSAILPQKEYSETGCGRCIDVDIEESLQTKSVRL